MHSIRKCRISDNATWCIGRLLTSERIYFQRLSRRSLFGNPCVFFFRIKIFSSWCPKDLCVLYNSGMFFVIHCYLLLVPVCYYFKIYLKCRETDMALIHWFTFWISSMARTGQGHSQKPRIHTRSPIGSVEPNHLNCCLVLLGSSPCLSMSQTAATALAQPVQSQEPGASSGSTCGSWVEELGPSPASSDVRVGIWIRSRAARNPSWHQNWADPVPAERSFFLGLLSECRIPRPWPRSLAGNWIGIGTGRTWCDTHMVCQQWRHKVVVLCHCAGRNNLKFF